MKQDGTKRLGFKFSLSLHLIVLTLALAVPWFYAIRAKPKPAENISFIRIPVTLQSSPVPDIPSPEPTVALPPEPQPVPETIKESLKQAEEKKPKPANKPKSVQKQTNRVVKAEIPVKPPVQIETPSEAEIRTILTAGIPSDDPNSPLAETNSALDSYYNQVFSRMYAAWNQPSQLKTLPGLKTDVRIIVEPEGKIIDRIKIKGSGNELMDDSVMKAVRSVKELPPLPIGYRKPQEIVVTFVLGE